jgi:hypothetical protein
LDAEVKQQAEQIMLEDAHPVADPTELLRYQVLRFDRTGRDPRHVEVQDLVLPSRDGLCTPGELARRVDRQLKDAFNDPDPVRGLKVAKGLAAQLEPEHPAAAASVREGLEDMFTVRRLGASDRLARSLSCTTPSSR